MSKVISAEVPDELADRIDATRAGEPPDYDESRSAAVKRLIQRGLDSDGGSDTSPVVYGAQMIGAGVLGASSASLPEAYGILGLILLFAPVIDERFSLSDRLS